LRGHSHLTRASFAAIQVDVTDALAWQVVPRLLASLRGQHLLAHKTAGLIACLRQTGRRAECPDLDDQRIESS
jgi:hypothetical protein